MDDLVDLLNSVDHEKVVNSGDAVISDEALEALLDRSMHGHIPESDSKEKEDGDTSKSVSSTAAAHTELFKVIAERDSSGNLIGGEDSEQGEDRTSGQGFQHDAKEASSDGEVKVGTKDVPEDVEQTMDLAESATPPTLVSDKARADTNSPSLSEPSDSGSTSEQFFEKSGSTSSTSSGLSCEGMDVDGIAGGVVVTDTTVSVSASEGSGEGAREAGSVVTSPILVSK